MFISINSGAVFYGKLARIHWLKIISFIVFTFLQGTKGTKKLKNISKKNAATYIEEILTRL